MTTNTLANIGLIIEREFTARVRKKIFIIPTILLAILACLGMFAPTVIQRLSQGDAQTKVVVLNKAGLVAGQDMAGLVAYLDRTLNAGATNASTGGGLPSASNKPAFVVTPATTTDAAALAQQVKDGRIDSVLVIGRQADGDVTFQYTTKRDGTSTSVRQVGQAANFLAASDRLQRAGLNATEQQQAFSPAVFTITSTSSSTFNNGKSDEENFANYIITTLMVVLMYVMIVMYGTWIAQGVVEEKSSRVMEIMINAATPLQLMFGKILGVGGAAFTQMGAIILGALAGLALQGPVNQALLGTGGGTTVHVPGASVGLLLLSFVFFVLGFALFSALHAGMGSLVSRQEDLSQAVSPLQMLLLPGYFIAVFALTAINETWVQILSFFPLFTPMLMIARIGIGQISAVEILAGIVLMIGAIFLAVWIAARLYRNGILYYGQKFKIWQFLRQPDNI
jgi:ABC-2 type transport system permease protein